MSFFRQSISPATSQVLTNPVLPWFNVRHYGAVGNGSVDDTAAINAAIAAANASASGGIIYFPPGEYRVTTSCTTIIKNGVSIRGDGEGDNGTGTTIRIDGNPNPAAENSGIFKFVGNSERGRILTCGVQGISFRCNNSMTTGCILELDFTWDFTIDRVSIYNCWSGIYIRQCNNTKLRNMRIADVRGTYGVHAFGNSTTRNGTPDRTDIITLWHVTITGEYNPNTNPGGSPNLDCLYFYGFVHTIYLYEVRLLQNRRGILCTTGPEVLIGATQTGPSLMYTHDIEIETSRLDCFVTDFLEDATLHSIYAWKSVTGYAFYFVQRCKRIVISEGKAGDAALGGIALGASTVQDVCISNFYTYATQGSGILAAAGDNISIQGGTLRNNSRYGIEISTATRVYANGVRLTNNTLGPISGPISVTSGLLESTSLATNATVGFSMIPIISGNPSGAPTFTSGVCPMVFVPSTNRLYIRIGSTWRFVATT